MSKYQRFLANSSKGADKKGKYCRCFFQDVPGYAFAGWGSRVKITNKQCILMLNLLGLFSGGPVSSAEGMPVFYFNQVRNF